MLSYLNLNFFQENSYSAITESSDIARTSLTSTVEMLSLEIISLCYDFQLHAVKGKIKGSMANPPSKH